MLREGRAFDSLPSAHAFRRRLAIRRARRGNRSTTSILWAAVRQEGTDRRSRATSLRSSAGESSSSGRGRTSSAGDDREEEGGGNEGRRRTSQERRRTSQERRRLGCVGVWTSLVRRRRGRGKGRRGEGSARRLTLAAPTRLHAPHGRRHLTRAGRAHSLRGPSQEVILVTCRSVRSPT